MKRRISGICIVAAAAVLAVAASGCSRKAQSPDVVLVTIDGDLPIVRGMDGAVVFTNAYTTSPSTLPAAASVLTGLVPPDHGLRVNGVSSLAYGVPTIADELLAIDAGYMCGAVLASMALDPVHGLTNGFSKYTSGPLARGTAAGLVASPSAVVDTALEFAREASKANAPVFLWVHISAFAGVRPGDVNGQIVAETNAVAQIERLLDGFGEKSVRAVVPLMAYNPDAPFRAMSIGDAATRVSVAFAGLGEGGVKADAFSIADVKGILLDAAAGKPQSLVASESVYSETVMPWYIFRLPVLQVERGSVSTLPPHGFGGVAPQVLGGQIEMIALRADGHLGEGLVPEFKGETAQEVGPEGEALISKAAAAVALLPVSERVKALRGLVEAHPGLPVLHGWLADALMSEKDYIDACNEYAKVSEYGINMVGAYRMQSKCHLLIGNIPAAIDKGENAFLLNPNDPTLRLELSQLLLNTGSALLSKQDFKSAEECLSRASWLEPRNPDAKVQLARLRLATGQTNSASALLGEALRIRPNHPVALKIKGEIGK